MVRKSLETITDPELYVINERILNLCFGCGTGAMDVFDVVTGDKEKLLSGIDRPALIDGITKPRHGLAGKYKPCAFVT